MMDKRSQPAFEQLSNTNRGPLVIIAAYIFLLSAFLAVLTKVWTRWGTTRNLIHTDWLILAGYVRSVVNNPDRAPFPTQIIGICRWADNCAHPLR